MSEEKQVIKESNETDVLDQIKRIEKAIKAQLLIKKIARLKELAREVNELKEQSVATLEALGLSEKDIKRVIDYVNELPDVKLSEKDKKKIREQVVEKINKEKQKEEGKIDNADLKTIFEQHSYQGGPIQSVDSGLENNVYRWKYDTGGTSGFTGLAYMANALDNRLMTVEFENEGLSCKVNL